MPEIGNTLREARIRRGLTIRDVEDVTKIRSKYLEALENDDFEVLPGPTYVKAFLRTYAAFLKLDADDLVDDYRRGHQPAQEDPGSYANDISRVPRSRVGSSRSRVDSSRSRVDSSRSRGASSQSPGGYLNESYSRTGRSRTSAERKRKRTRRTQRGYALVGIAAVVVVVLLAWLGSGRGEDAASIGPDNINPAASSVSSGGEGGTTVPATSGGSVTASSATGTTESNGATGGTAVGTTSAGDVTLVVSVTEGSCWLVIREDSENGAEIYAGTLSAGGEQTFDSSKRYWMLVGRPEALALTVNGSMYTLTAPAGSFVVTGAGVERSQ